MNYIYLYGVIGILVGIWWFINNWIKEKSKHGEIVLLDFIVVLFSIILWPLILLDLSMDFPIKRF